MSDVTTETVGVDAVAVPSAVVSNCCGMDDFVTGQEIAKMFKVSNSTVNLWKRQGMPFYGKSSCARFKKSDVVVWQREQSQIPITKRVKKVKTDEVSE